MDKIAVGEGCDACGILASARTFINRKPLLFCRHCAEQSRPSLEKAGYEIEFLMGGVFPVHIFDMIETEIAIHYEHLHTVDRAMIRAAARHEGYLADPYPLHTRSGLELSVEEVLALIKEVPPLPPIRTPF